jgi:hypothetical protein
MDAQEAEAEDNVTAARLWAEVGVFALLISRFRLGNPRLADGFDAVLRELGEGPVLDLAYELEDSGDLDRLMTMEVDQVLASVWPRLQPLAQVD